MSEDVHEDQPKAEPPQKCAVCDHFVCSKDCECSNCQLERMVGLKA